MYKCMNCGKIVEIDLSSSRRIICPYCGQRILKKVRPKTPKKVFAV